MSQKENITCKKRNARPNNNQLITCYLHVCYLLWIWQYPVNTTYNTKKVTKQNPSKSILLDLIKMALRCQMTIFWKDVFVWSNGRDKNCWLFLLFKHFFQCSFYPHSKQKVPLHNYLIGLHQIWQNWNSSLSCSDKRKLCLIIKLSNLW